MTRDELIQAALADWEAAAWRLWEWRFRSEPRAPLRTHGGVYDPAGWPWQTVLAVEHGGPLPPLARNEPAPEIVREIAALDPEGP